MNVWMRKTRKQATCSYCEKPVLNGDYQVVCQHYMRLRSGKVWWKRRSFHPQCWIDQAVAELDTRVVVETRGRKRLEMADATKTARTAILRRRGSIIQRIKREIGSEEQDIDRIVHLGELLNGLKEEIEQFGGVPKSWL